MKSPLVTAEEALEAKYVDKFVKYEPEGQSELYGRVDRIAIDSSKIPHTVIVMIDMKRFEEDITTFNTHITLI